MLIGMLLCGVLAGFGAALWALIAAQSILMAALLYPVAGMAGAALFLGIALLRAGQARNAAVSPAYAPEPAARAARIA